MVQSNTKYLRLLMTLMLAPGHKEHCNLLSIASCVAFAVWTLNWTGVLRKLLESGLQESLGLRESPKLGQCSATVLPSAWVYTDIYHHPQHCSRPCTRCHGNHLLWWLSFSIIMHLPPMQKWYTMVLGAQHNFNKKTGYQTHTIK